MELPGGIHLGSGRLERQIRFKEFNGSVEVSLWSVKTSAASRINAVDQLIGSAFICDEPAFSAAELCVGDRHFLLSKLAAFVDQDIVWMSHKCTSCGSLQDFMVDLTELPVKPAGPSFPFADVELSIGAVTLRCPTGRDQLSVSHIEDTRRAAEVLALSCIVTKPKTLDSGTSTLTGRDLEIINDALEAISPEIANSASVSCIDCGETNTVEFDVAMMILNALSNPLEDVHDIARAYHWSEQAILELPRDRRRAYLDLIDQDAGSVR